MGLVAYTGRAREGQTGCEATEWVVGDIGEVPESGRAGDAAGWRMTAGERGGSMTQAWSGDVGMMSVMVTGSTMRGGVGVGDGARGGGWGLWRTRGGHGRGRRDARRRSG